MEDIDKILIKMHYKARKEALKDLLKEYKGDTDMITKIKKILEKEPANIWKWNKN